ncbi:hypothetical protein [Nocardioides bigeumensis]|uniref:Alpha/beta fold hydrolase n=1 Tax=Nocardioides bigeumensis TaxID=433657 RepID=A0ABN2XMW4_9ACTN
MTVGVRIEPVGIVADDGRLLRGTRFRPESAPVGYVLVAPAMATPARFYRQFASWLASERQLAVLTFEYRGTTADASALRRENADLLTWAADAAAALEHLDAERRSENPAGAITWIGHSFGGQILGFVRHDLLNAAILVATGHGYFHHNPPHLRRRAPLLWRLVVPLTTRVSGYFPGRRLGILGDLPSRVARQWGRWCMHPDYWGADVQDITQRHALVTHPVTLISLTDDALVTPSGPKALAAQLLNAPVTHARVHPSHFGVRTIGHHGLFRASMAHAWRDVFAIDVPRSDATDAQRSYNPSSAA